MTTMTIIDQLLVLLDDEQPHTLDEMTTTISGRSKQTISSTLGRLLAKGWVARKTGRARGQYSITQAGRDHVTDYLSQIKLRSSDEWDGSWEQVVFNIPERDRKRRDDLRALLIDLGYGRLHSWLWISPWSHREQIEQYIADTRSEKEITILRTGTLDPATNQRIGHLFEWDWKGLEDAYQQFIRSAETYLRARMKDAYTARCIVYEYAKVLATDPKLPDTLPTRIEPARKAYELYQKVRPYCYEK